MKLNFDNETGRSFLSYTLLHYNIGIVYFTSSNLTIYDYQYIGITWYKYGYSNS